MFIVVDGVSVAFDILHIFFLDNDLLIVVHRDMTYIGAVLPAGDIELDALEDVKVGPDQLVDSVPVSDGGITGSLSTDMEGKFEVI